MLLSLFLSFYITEASCSEGTQWSVTGGEPCDDCTACTDAGLHEISACTASSDAVCVSASTIVLNTAKASIDQAVEYTISVPIPRDDGAGTSVAIQIELPGLSGGGSAYGYGSLGGWADAVVVTATGGKVSGTTAVTFGSLEGELLTVTIGTDFKSTESAGEPHTSAEEVTVDLQMFVVDDGSLSANDVLEQATVAIAYGGGSATVNGEAAAAAVKIVLPLLSWTVVPSSTSGVEAGDGITVSAIVEHVGTDGEGTPALASSSAASSSQRINRFL